MPQEGIIATVLFAAAAWFSLIFLAARAMRAAMDNNSVYRMQRENLHKLYPRHLAHALSSKAALTAQTWVLGALAVAAWGTCLLFAARTIHLVVLR